MLARSRRDAVLVIAGALGLAACAEQAPARCPQVAPPVATASATLLIPAGAVAGRDAWLVALLSPDGRAGAARRLGRPVPVQDLQAEPRGADGIAITASGAGIDAAMARCTAWIAAGEDVIRGQALGSTLDAERARALADIAALGASLVAIPADRIEPPPTTREEAFVRARFRAATIDVTKRPEDALAAAAPPSLLAALARADVEARRTIAELDAALGTRHPDRLAAMARRDVLVRRFARQREIERAANDAYLAAFAEIPLATARFAWLERWLGRSDRGGRVEASSLDPIPLRLLALEDALAEADLASAQVARGPRHPEVVAIEARRRAIAERFTDELGADLRLAKSDAEVSRRAPAALQHLGPLPADDRAARLDARRTELAAIVAELERRRAAVDHQLAALAATRCSVQAAP